MVRSTMSGDREIGTGEVVGIWDTSSVLPRRFMLYVGRVRCDCDVCSRLGLTRNISRRVRITSAADRKNGLIIASFCTNVSQG
jgi:hypothetical protein